MKEQDTTQPTYVPHIHPTANITQDNSYTQSLSITWKLILCIGGPIIIIFSWCLRKKIKGKEQTVLSLYFWVILVG